MAQRAIRILNLELLISNYLFKAVLIDINHQDKTGKILLLTSDTSEDARIVRI